MKKYLISYSFQIIEIRYFGEHNFGISLFQLEYEVERIQMWSQSAAMFLEVASPYVGT